jgi:diadenosine tetraphosphatase ApaH/serine/threonine PP2A family protein phosphatase
LDIRSTGGHQSGPRLIVVHGTPVLNTVYWTSDRPGRPKDGDWRACFALLDFARDHATAVEFVRVEYDVERAADRIESSGLPSDFADHLRKGGARS